MTGLLLFLSMSWAEESLSEVQAESLTVREDEVLLTEGKIVDAEGVMTFGSGSLERSTGAIDFSDVSIELTSGWFIKAARLRGQLNGQAVLSDATITACDCDCPVWAVEAVSLTVEGLEEAKVEGGSLVVFEGFSLPFPGFSFPLRPGTIGIGLPGIAWELGNLRVTQPVVFRLGRDWDLELKPGWWRGPFLEGRVVDEERQQATWRVEWADEFAALAEVDHVSQGPWGSAAVSGIWVDRPVSQKRAFTYLDRQRAFLEQQARVGLGAFRGEGWAWQEAGADGARWQAGFVDQGWQRGALFGSHGLMTGWMLGHWRSELRAQSGWVEALGPLELEVNSAFRGLDYDGKEQAADLSVEVEAGLVATGHHGSWRHEITLGAAAGGRERVLGDLEPLSEWDRAATGWVWGPRIESLWWGHGHVRVDGWVHLEAGQLSGWQASGLFKRGALDWRLRSARALGSTLHGLTLYERGARSETWFGLHAQSETGEELQPLMNAGARFAVPMGSVDLWPAATVLMAGKALESATGSLVVESTCDCFRVGLDAGWTADREEVILGLSLDLLPSGSPGPPSWALPSPDTGSFSQP